VLRYGMFPQHSKTSSFQSLYPALSLFAKLSWNSATPPPRSRCKYTKVEGGAKQQSRHTFKLHVRHGCNLFPTSCEYEYDTAAPFISSDGYELRVVSGKEVTTVQQYSLTVLSDCSLYSLCLTGLLRHQVGVHPPKSITACVRRVRRRARVSFVPIRRRRRRRQRRRPRLLPKLHRTRRPPPPLRRCSQPRHSHPRPSCQRRRIPRPSCRLHPSPEVPSPSRVPALAETA